MFDPATTINWLDDIANWKFSLSPIGTWFQGFFSNLYQQYGVTGVITAVVVLLIAGVAFPPTRYLASQLMNNIVRALFTAIQLQIAFLGFMISRFGVTVGIAALREAGSELSKLRLLPERKKKKEENN